MRDEKVKYVKEDQREWTVSAILKELEKAGSEQTKRTYLRHGAKEPLYGVTTREMKVIMKKTGKSYTLAMELYGTDNYDAMYFAGMITEPEKMSKEDFEKWIKTAYCEGIADYTVASALAQTSFADEVADDWINSPDGLYRSAGWSCYCWLLGSRKDSYFHEQKIKHMLDVIHNTIHQEANRVKYAMNSFVIAVGISYIPLHEYAYEIAQSIGVIEVDMGKTNCKTPHAQAYIKKAIDADRIGFKRKIVRC